MRILAELKTPRAPATAPGRVILVDLGPDALHPLVTWWQNDENGGRCSGHYFKREQFVEAHEDFIARCNRGF